MAGPADYFAPGDYNANCYQCGFKFKASQLRRQWQGFYTCESCWEPRQPQDFVRAVPDNQTVPWAQPASTDAFLPTCSPNGMSAVPGEAEPGCMVPGYLSPMYYDDYFTP